MNLNENRIRDLAYQIWESEGRPHGQAARHWETACKLCTDPEPSHQMSASIPDSRRVPLVTQQQAESKSAGKVHRKSKPDATSQMR